jgi:hypothetical protein
VGGEDGFYGGEVVPGFEEDGTDGMDDDDDCGVFSCDGLDELIAIVPGVEVG